MGRNQNHAKGYERHYSKYHKSYTHKHHENQPKIHSNHTIPFFGLLTQKDKGHLKTNTAKPVNPKLKPYMKLQEKSTKLQVPFKITEN